MSTSLLAAECAAGRAGGHHRNCLGMGKAAAMEQSSEKQLQALLEQLGQPPRVPDGGDEEYLLPCTEESHHRLLSLSQHTLWEPLKVIKPVFRDNVLGLQLHMNVTILVILFLHTTCPLPQIKYTPYF